MKNSPDNLRRESANGLPSHGNVMSPPSHMVFAYCIVFELMESHVQCARCSFSSFFFLFLGRIFLVRLAHYCRHVHVDVCGCKRHSSHAFPAITTFIRRLTCNGTCLWMFSYSATIRLVAPFNNARYKIALSFVRRIAIVTFLFPCNLYSNFKTQLF